jgi:trehalose synthase
MTLPRLTEVYSRRAHLADYINCMSAKQRSDLDQLAAAGRGLRVVHISSTSAGGGVAELLHSLVPLSRAVGIDAHWYVLPPDGSFFHVTKQLHNWLQGGPGTFGTRRRATYLRYLEQLTAAVNELRADVWVIHDPQPLALRALVPLQGPAIWRCHIDCSTPNRQVRDQLMPWIRDYDRVIFSIPQFRLPGLDPQQVVIVSPAIDPLADKNRPLAPSEAHQTLTRLGIDPKRPLIAQIARFDRWKGHAEAVRIFRRARASVSGLQLALVGTFMANDDPEAPKVYAEVHRLASEDPDVHLFTDPVSVGATQINAFQVASNVVLQRSSREGFGLTVTEAMWKGRPVIARPVGGITTQIEHGHSGFLIDSADDAAEQVVDLLRAPTRARRIGAAARRRVRNRFLLPRLLVDDLRLYVDVSRQLPSKLYA